MGRKQLIPNGSLVQAQSFSGDLISGLYRGPCNSYGVYILGRPVNTFDDIILHKCISLTLEVVALKATPKTRQKFRNPGRPAKDLPSVYIGDPCTGLTKQGERITGKYAGASDYPFAFIRGISPKTQELGTYKIVRKSLVLLKP